MKNINTLISKWVLEDKMNDQALGQQVRKYYWREIHSYEHWLNEESEISEKAFWGYGDDSRVDDGGDEIY